MKYFKSIFLVLVLFQFAVACANAQNAPSMKNLELISGSEKSAHSKLNQPREQLIVNNYDLKQAYTTNRLAGLWRC